MINPRQSHWSDPLNRLGNRGIANTPKNMYNCGGYALGTYCWYWPGRTEEEHDEIMEYAEIEDWNNALKLAAEAIIGELDGWQLAQQQAVMAREYDPCQYEIVAMRMCEYDYHFWKLGRNWNWYDKMGGAGWIDRHSFQSVLYSTWCGRYDSPIIFFVRTR